MTHRMARITTLLIGTALLCAAARADDAGITVSGTGQAKAKPTSVELNATCAAEAELTADAVVKFNDMRKKAMAALDGLKLPGLTVTPGGISIAAAVDMSAMQRLNGGPSGNSKTRVTEDLKLTLAGIDKMDPKAITDAVMKLIDTGRDAGLAVGPKVPTNYYEFQSIQNTGFNIAQFRLDDADIVRDQAYQAAMKDARAKAEKLADLAGVKLGPVLAVHESNPDGNGEGNVRAMLFEAVRGMDGGTKVTATSGNLADIPMKVGVTVQYAIVTK